MQDQPRAKERQHRQADCTDLREQLAAAYDTHAAKLYQYALMILADPSAAEDAVQQTFTKLMAMGRKICELDFVNGYLHAAVRNESYRILRRGRVRKRADKDLAGMLRPVEEQVDHKEMQQTIEQALRTLPAEQRELIHLKVYEQLTFRQIAMELDISINTAASRYRYAIDKLRSFLPPDLQI